VLSTCEERKVTENKGKSLRSAQKLGIVLPYQQDYQQDFAPAKRQQKFLQKPIAFLPASDYVFCSVCLAVYGNNGRGFYPFTAKSVTKRHEIEIVRKIYERSGARAERKA
jgi:hypothetical protein